ncbi:MAG: hypothetical protein C0614_05800 [Desulfuromonas sp.]|nr:MAG: hypothetical protein C0614_05800 [Desulfuromonas sp.]
MDAHGGISALGRRMAHYPAHPRLSRLLVAAIDAGFPGVGSELVALLSERDLLQGRSRPACTTGTSDLLERLVLLQRDPSPRSGPVQRAAAYWRKRTQAGREIVPDPDTISSLLACAYPDRIAQRRSQGGGALPAAQWPGGCTGSWFCRPRCRMAGGCGAGGARAGRWRNPAGQRLVPAGS